MARKSKAASLDPNPPRSIAKGKPDPGGPLKIVCPSHRRANMLTTHLAVELDAVCVAESQVDEYRRNYPNVEFVSHPDSVIGLHAKRQWMYEYFGNMFMFDDDVKNVARSWMGFVQVLPTVLKPHEVRAVVNQVFEMAKDCNAYLFGLSTKASPMAYRPFKPFRFSGVVMGASYGVRAGSKLYWNPKMSSKEDSWIAALNAWHHRICVIDNRYFAATHECYTRRGGLTGLRTKESEKADAELLIRTFGESVFEYRGGADGKESGNMGFNTVKSESPITFRAPF